jgi:hypothetical protein
LPTAACSSQRPCTDDTSNALVAFDRAVVDDHKLATIGARALDPPIGITPIGFTVIIGVSDCLLDLKPRQASFSEPKLSMVSPDDSADAH